MTEPYLLLTVNTVAHISEQTGKSVEELRSMLQERRDAGLPAVIKIPITVDYVATESVVAAIDEVKVVSDIEWVAHGVAPEVKAAKDDDDEDVPESWHEAE